MTSSEKRRLARMVITAGLMVFGPLFVAERLLNWPVGMTPALLVHGQISPTFTLSVSPASATVARNSSTRFALTLTSVSGFAGSITLGAKGYPLGTSGFSPSSPVALAAGQTLTVTSTVTPSGSASLQDYPVTFTADSGSIHREANVTLTVSAPPTLTSISPSTGTAGTTVRVAFTGTNFITGLKVSAVRDIMVSNVSVVSLTAATATFTISATAAAGPRDVTVTTSLGSSTAQTFTVSTFSTSTLALTNFPSSTDAQQQHRVGLALTSPYGAPLTGTLKLSFLSTAVVRADDPAVEFSSGGRSAAFTIATNSTQALFGTATNVGVQTGTVVGTISLTVTLLVAGQTIATDVSMGRMSVNDKAPTVRTVAVSRGTQTSNQTNFEVIMTGFSTSRALSRATFTFTGTNVDSTAIDVDVNTMFTTWYRSSTSLQFGSQFTLRVPFTTSGGTLPSGSVSVTLTNSLGTSSARTASY